ncbi:HGGxSTG domain-containing protein [Streptomyces ossamyceticus]|uniref:HGGxSTG domain-containing protein n=1 Tax=Streptomyces ossamyceticus TaxID=249581 RepID=UPI0036F06BF9
MASIGPPEDDASMGRRRCTARRTDGNPCGNRPLKGQSVCKFHGGAAPQSKAAAVRRQVEAEARQVLAELGVSPVGDPLEALLKLAGQVIAWQEATAALVNQLDSIRYQAGSGEQLRAEIVLYERAMDRAIQVLSAIARLGIDERLVRVTERQADALIGALNAALVAAGVDGERANEARRAAARHLRSVD